MFYQIPLLSIILGLFLAMVPGSRPWKDLYRGYTWAELPARFRRISIKNEVPSFDPSDDLPKGRVFRVKVALEYSPRDMFGAVARRPGFPKWLLLPISRVFWEESPDSFVTVAAARDYARQIQYRGHPRVLVNPEDYTQAEFFREEIPWYAKVGVVLIIMGFFMLVVLLGTVINARRQAATDSQEGETGNEAAG